METQWDLLKWPTTPIEIWLMERTGWCPHELRQWCIQSHISLKLFGLFDDIIAENSKIRTMGKSEFTLKALSYSTISSHMKGFIFVQIFEHWKALNVGRYSFERNIQFRFQNSNSSTEQKCRWKSIKWIWIHSMHYLPLAQWLEAFGHI